MRFRTRTAWLEIAAGFQTLFAAVAAFEASDLPMVIGPSWLPHLAASALLLAACAIFLLHGLRTIRRARQACFAFAAIVSLPVAAWFAAGGQTELAALQAILGLWFVAAVFFAAADPGPRAVGEQLPSALSLYACASFGTLAVLFASRRTTVSIIEGVAFLAIAAALASAERHHDQRLRVAVALGAGIAAVALATAFFTAGFVGASGAFLSLFAVLMLSNALIDGLPESADDLADTTLRQREICLYERAGETTLWAIVALSALYVNFLEQLDTSLYFAAVLSAAVVSQYVFRFRPAKTLSERRYPLTLLSVVVVSIPLISALGGPSGPFMYFAYLAVYAGTVIVAPSWSMATACIYIAYVLADFLFRWLASGQTMTAIQFSQHAARAASLSTTLILTGLYAAWTGRRRAKIEQVLLAANRQLAEALKSAVREREQSKRQAEDQRQLNDDLIEMRSALMNVLEDVEESKRQIELERRREVASLNALGEGVVATEKDGKIFLCNPIAASLLGLEPKEVIGQSVDRAIRLFQEDGDILQTGVFEAAFAGRAAVLGNRLLLMRNDGRRVPVSGAVTPYFDEADQMAGIVLAFRDVTAEREISRQKSDFISIASHQLRTPLSTLRWFLDLLLAGDAGKLTSTQKEYLTDMSVSTVRMIKLVGDLLDITRIESGHLKPSPERVAVAAFTEELLREFAPLIKSRDIRFSSEISKEAREFHADPALIHQAIANILSNAIKYTEYGGSVSLSVHVDGGMVVFTIKDTGSGIPQNQQYRVYDKFFRGENVIAKETVGNGLGLYVTHLIVALSGGLIWFESYEGEGTSFSVALPVAASEGTMAA